MVAVVGLLDAASRGRVVTCHCQTNSGFVTKHDLLLHQALAKRTPTDDGATVVVLQSTGHNLARAGRLTVDEYHNRNIFQHPMPTRFHILARTVATFGIDNETTLGQKLVGDIHCGSQIATRVAPKVKDQFLHALGFQVFDTLSELIDRSRRELTEFQIADFFIKHIGDVNAIGGNRGTCDGIVEQAFHPPTQHLDANLRVFRTFQLTHHILVLQVFTCHQGVVNIDDTVARQNAHFLRRASFDDVDDGDGILFQAELYSDAIKATQ